MKVMVIWLVALMLLVVAPEPVFAAEPPDLTAGRSGCFAHYAEWSRNDDSAHVPPGTWTRIRTCTVGGHKVRINTADWPVASYQCGAGGPIGRVSAWVDGEKVVSNGEIGTGAFCFDSDAKLVTRIIVNDQMHLTVCKALGSSRREKPYTKSELTVGQRAIAIFDEQGDETDDFIEQCSLTQLSRSAGATDAYFNLRTPPGLALSAGSDAMCPTVQAQFVSPAPNESELGYYATALPSALDAYKTNTVTLGGKPYDSASAVEKAPGKITHYALDVDHDGVADTLTFTEKNDDSGVEYPGQYSWTSGASGKSFNVTGSLLKAGVQWTTDLYPDPVRDATAFVAAGGKVWLYRAEVGLQSSYPTYDVEEMEIRDGAIDEGDDIYGTRWLYELRPDGTARLACKWHARKRPEEFL
jgi:hypothetical protein